jgi:carbon storage regulator
VLILSRKVDQRIVIGGGIEITVVEVRNGHVRLGISAPRSVPVHRKELVEQVVAENIQALGSAVAPGVTVEELLREPDCA